MRHLYIIHTLALQSLMMIIYKFNDRQVSLASSSLRRICIFFWLYFFLAPSLPLERNFMVGYEISLSLFYLDLIL